TRSAGGARRRAGLHRDAARNHAGLCTIGFAPAARRDPGFRRLARADRGTGACCRPEPNGAETAAGARHDGPHAVRPHSFVRATQRLVLSCIPVGSWTDLLGRLEPCLAPDVALGPVLDGYRCRTAVAGAGSAHAGRIIPGLARCCGDATRPGKPVTAW